MEFDFDRSNDRAVFASMLHFLIANMKKRALLIDKKSCSPQAVLHLPVCDPCIVMRYVINASQT